MAQKELYDNLREVFVLLAFNTGRVLRPYRLNLDQYDTLLILAPDKGRRMGDLVKKVLSDNSKMTRIVDYLEANGWAERRPDPGDRRAQLVYITAAGREQRRRAQAAHETALQTWLAALADDQQRRLLQLLDQVRVQLTGGAADFEHD